MLEKRNQFFICSTWLQYLLDRFLLPWGYQLDGTISWQGNDEADYRIASREILPAGKILALFSSTHWSVYRKVSARFVLLLVLPIDLFRLRLRVRYLMKEVGGCSSWWLSQEIPRETRSHTMVRGEGAS